MGACRAPARSATPPTTAPSRPAIPSGTLTIVGDYVGTGGLLEVEAILGGDASPTDLLHVTGNTSGATDVRVINLGGSGAPTIEGIRIVQVDGISAGTFALLGDHVFDGDQAVVGGAYAYRLYQGSVSVPGDGDWYLRSSLIAAPPGPGPGPAPLFQPGVPIYESYANVLQSFNELGTLRQRVGKRAWAGALEADPRQGMVDGALWGRMEGSYASFSPLSSTSGAQYDVRTWKLQMGVDGILNEGEAGTLVAGLSAHFGSISSSISSIYGDGAIASTGHGAALTWYGAGGFYLDAQGQVTWYDSDLTSSTAGLALVEGNRG